MVTAKSKLLLNTRNTALRGYHMKFCFCDESARSEALKIMKLQILNKSVSLSVAADVKIHIYFILDYIYIYNSIVTHYIKYRDTDKYILFIY